MSWSTVLSPTTIFTPGHDRAADAGPVTSSGWGGGVPGVVQRLGTQEGAIPGTNPGPDPGSRLLDLTLDRLRSVHTAV